MWLGTALGMGFEPANGLPALGADVLPVEVRFDAGARRVSAQVDWAQMAASAALTPRATVGLAGFVEREGPKRVWWGPGVDLAVGTELAVDGGELSRRLTGAVAPALRAGFSLGGDGVRVCPAVRAALGLRDSQGGADVWARALVEVSVVGRVSR